MAVSRRFKNFEELVEKDTCLALKICEEKLPNFQKLAQQGGPSLEAPFFGDGPTETDLNPRVDQRRADIPPGDKGGTSLDAFREGSDHQNLQADSTRSQECSTAGSTSKVPSKQRVERAKKCTKSLPIGGPENLEDVLSDKSVPSPLPLDEDHHSTQGSLRQAQT